jgi:hypothetical protein
LFGQIFGDGRLINVGFAALGLFLLDASDAVAFDVAGRDQDGFEGAQTEILKGKGLEN